MKKKNQTRPEPLTVSAYATATGMDRRTVARRLVAHGVKPVGKNGHYVVYDVEDMDEVTEGIVADKRPTRDRSAGVGLGREHGKDSAILAIAACLPLCLPAVLEMAGVKATQKQLDAIVFDTWLGLSMRIKNEAFGLATRTGIELPSGRIMPELLTDTTQLPESFQAVIARTRQNKKAT